MKPRAFHLSSTALNPNTISICRWFSCIPVTSWAVLCPCDRVLLWGDLQKVIPTGTGLVVPSEGSGGQGRGSSSPFHFWEPQQTLLALERPSREQRWRVAAPVGTRLLSQGSPSAGWRSVWRSHCCGTALLWGGHAARAPLPSSLAAAQLPWGLALARSHLGQGQGGQVTLGDTRGESRWQQWHCSLP